MSEVFKIKMVLNKKLNEVSEDEQEQFWYNFLKIKKNSLI